MARSKKCLCDQNRILSALDAQSWLEKLGGGFSGRREEPVGRDAARVSQVVARSSGPVINSRVASRGTRFKRWKTPCRYGLQAGDVYTRGGRAREQ